MAEHLTQPPPPPAASRPRAGKLPRSPHADKFRAVLALLIGLALGALAIAVAVLVAHRDNTNTSTPAASTSASSSTLAWSLWRPTSSGNTAATEIADFIAPSYRLSASEQLAVITSISTTQLDTSTGTFTGAGLTVAVNTSGTAKASESSLRVPTGETVGYDLCGQGGPDCSVAGSSTVRTLLLRREALELALYTFKYLPKAANVVVVLPPRRTGTAKTGKRVTVAVFLDRADVAQMLTEPLEATLTTDPPATSRLKVWAKTTEAELVDVVTGRGLFSEQIEAQQDGGNLLILTPLPTS